MDEGGEVRTLRNVFYAGSFDGVDEGACARACVSACWRWRRRAQPRRARADARGITPEVKTLAAVSGRAAVLRDMYLFRSQLERGMHEQVAKAIDKKAASVLQAVRQLALWAAGEKEVSARLSPSRSSPSHPLIPPRSLAALLRAQAVLETIGSWSGDAALMADPIMRFLVAQVYFLAGNSREALKLVQAATDLDARALQVQIFLEMNRLDLAQKALKAMQDDDDDDVLTALAASWVALTQGGDKVNEAHDNLHELVDKFGATIRLHNSLAVCQMQRRSFAEAFELLKSARAMAIQRKLRVPPETYINSLVCVKHLRKGQAAIDQIVADFAQAHPTHGWHAQQRDKAEEFDSVAAKLKGNA